MSTKKITLNRLKRRLVKEKAGKSIGYDYRLRGVEGTRTPVQTYPSKAFYMFIPALLVGKQQETDEPIASLAG